MLRRWRVDCGREFGQTIHAEGARIFAADLSADGKWLVCGLKCPELGDGKAYVAVWDLQTYEKVFDIQGHNDSVFSIHIAPDSTKFATGSADKTASTWSLTTGQRLVGPLKHEGVVVAARFSPAGDRIATATAKNPDAKTIRIYNSKNGQRLLDSMPFLVNTHISSPLAWSGDGRHLFAVSYSEVKCFDTFSGSLHSKWPVPGAGSSASIALSRNQKFIVVVAYKTLSFWDAITHEQIGTAVEHESPVWSVALSSSDHHVATGEENGKVIFRCLRNILPGSYIMINVRLQVVNVTESSNRPRSTSLSSTSWVSSNVGRLHVLILLMSLSASQLPLMSINYATFTSWTQGDLTCAEQLLEKEISYPFHYAHALAQRAFVRARSKQWNLAIHDAKEVFLVHLLYHLVLTIAR